MSHGEYLTSWVTVRYTFVLAVQTGARMSGARMSGACMSGHACDMLALPSARHNQGVNDCLRNSEHCCDSRV